MTGTPRNATTDPIESFARMTQATIDRAKETRNEFDHDLAEQAVDALLDILPPIQPPPQLLGRRPIAPS